jgi:hypothetical protein
MNRKTALSIKKAWKNHFTVMSHDDILTVLRKFPPKFTDRDIAFFFDVTPETINDWRLGDHKPNGANKLVFNTLLFEEE